jgi:transcriptional regulator with XRE-family HTH domain
MLSEFGKFLRKIRIDRGELLRDMAEKLGVTASYLSAVETGKRNIPETWVDMLVDLYRLDAATQMAISEAAARSAKAIKLELGAASVEKREAAVMFARQFDGLDESDAIQIRELLTSFINKGDQKQ